MMGELKKTFSPEFLNRIDEIIVFHPLEQEQAAKIVRLMLKGVTDRLRERGIGTDVLGGRSRAAFQGRI